MFENPMVSGYGFPAVRDPKVITTCSCGCGEEIVEGYEHIEYEGEWFAEMACLMKWLGAEWKVAGE